MVGSSIFPEDRLETSVDVQLDFYVIIILNIYLVIFKPGLSCLLRTPDRDFFFLDVQ